MCIIKIIKVFKNATLTAFCSSGSDDNITQGTNTLQKISTVRIVAQCNRHLQHTRLLNRIHNLDWLLHRTTVESWRTPSRCQESIQQCSVETPYRKMSHMHRCNLQTWRNLWLCRNSCFCSRLRWRALPEGLL